jgi:Protein of unknown function (DUF3618)
MSDDEVRAAEFQVDRTRSKMIATLQEISRELQPHRLVEEAWEKAKDKGADLAENAVDAVRARPVAAGAVVTGIVAFLARDALFSLAGKIAGSGKSKRPRRPRRSSKDKVEETSGGDS